MGALAEQYEGLQLCGSLCSGEALQLAFVRTARICPKVIREYLSTQRWSSAQRQLKDLVEKPARPTQRYGPATASCAASLRFFVWGGKPQPALRPRCAAISK